jgi:hypothetical protein
MRRIIAASVLAAAAALTALTSVHAGAGHARADSPDTVSCCKA